MHIGSYARVPYLTFDSLDRFSGRLAHGFSTRLGGVSGGFLSSMNLGFEKGDDPENVSENYRRMGKAIGIDPSEMVMARLEHSTCVRRVGAGDAGRGIVKEPLDGFCDGLITNEPHIALVCRYADCIPLFFFDPVKKAIGLSHSGWRGTAARMACASVNAMREAFLSDPADIIACIGPGICGSCFEVGEEVADIFARNFPDTSREMIKRRADGKYLVDLWGYNRLAMLESGISEDHIEMSGLCTCCNPDLLFSHRATGGRRGDMAGFLMLK